MLLDLCGTEKMLLCAGGHGTYKKIVIERGSNHVRTKMTTAKD